jgi:rfaE bifunctional protein kinase chain/domain
MNTACFKSISQRYSGLRVAVIGDFCLDRYLEIDPAKAETSIETGLAVHNVLRVRPQPGGAGTIVNNLCALGAGEIHVVGIAGEDGEGWELRRALQNLPGVHQDHFLSTPLRQTFTYTKPIECSPGKPPVELNRLDFKNWTPTPASLETRLCESIRALVHNTHVDAMILLEQVDAAQTGVLTRRVLAQIHELAQSNGQQIIVADSRRGLRDFPPFIFKMNAAELARLLNAEKPFNLSEVRERAAELAKRQNHRVFITLAESGMIAADTSGQTVHVPALPLRGPIDIVGAGDAVTANLTLALASGASLTETLEIASAAASVVIHQLGTTGAATVPQISELLKPQD